MTLLWLGAAAGICDACSCRLQGEEAPFLPQPLTTPRPEGRRGAGARAGTSFTEGETWASYMEVLWAVRHDTGKHGLGASVESSSLRPSSELTAGGAELGALED